MEHSATDDDTNKVSSSMLAGYMVVLAVLLAYYATTTVIFLRHRSVPGIRRRSITLTMVSVVTAVLTTVVLMLLAPLRALVPCWLSLWVSTLLFPLLVLCGATRALNLAVARRVHEAAVLHLEEAVSAQEEAVRAEVAGRAGRSNTLKANGSAMTNTPAWTNALGSNDGKAHDAKRSGSMSSLMPVQPPTKDLLNERLSPLAKWFLRHMYLFSVGAHIGYLGIIQAVMFIYLLVVQLAAAQDKSPTGLNQWPNTSCAARWEYSLLYAWMAFLIALSVLTLVLLILRDRVSEDMRELRDHGYELMGTSATWAVVLAVYLALTFTLEWYRTAGGAPPLPPPDVPVFPATNLIVLGCLLDHSFSVLWPVLRARYSTQGAGWRTVHNQPTIHPRAENYTGLRAQFHAILTDPEQFREFKLFSVRSLSVENAFFYDTCRSLLRAAQTHNAIVEDGGVDPGYRERLKRRLDWLYSTFLQASADMEVNLRGTTKRRLDYAIRDGVLDVEGITTAMKEVEELMFYDTYPRYMKAREEEGHPLPDLLPRASMEQVV